MRIKPTLREEARIEISSLCTNAIANVLESTANFPFKTCLRCDNFDEPKELCKLVNMRPPAKVIAYGCDKFCDDNWIPF